MKKVICTYCEQEFPEDLITWDDLQNPPLAYCMDCYDNMDEIIKKIV